VSMVKNRECGDNRINGPGSQAELGDPDDRKQCAGITTGKLDRDLRRLPVCEEDTEGNIMNRKIFTFATVAALVGMLAFSGIGLAAPGGIPGPPDNGGGGGGAPDLGDLIILFRDANGVPIPSAATQVPDPETGELVDGGLCWQPIAFNVDDPTACPASCVVDTTIPSTVDVDQYNCAVATGCSGCTQEVEFGRVNEARSPETVFESQLEDVIVNLATADCRTIDPAGRLVATRLDADLSVLVSTIDSPLQNLAIYRQLMLTGTLGAPLPEGADTLDTAARGLGAASDKAGEVNVDLVAYLNQIMGLDVVPTILDPKLCETYREEVQGVIQLVEKCFLDYGAYGYDREANFTALPAPAYIPGPPETPEEGWFEYLALVPGSDQPVFEIVYGPILDAVFPDTPFVEFEGDNIGGFAQASDDTRAVIDFMHTNQVPVDFETAVTCEASGDIAYDVAISGVSGLQVPKNIVDGSADREFIVTVANVGGDDTAPVTVTVTAIPASGGSILADLDGDGQFTDPSPFVFPTTDIAAGGSTSFSALISIDIGQRTTIDWTAVAAAPDDVNLSNNGPVTATSNVKVTGGGGRP
jgi:hypothetical protein